MSSAKFIKAIPKTAFINTKLRTGWKLQCNVFDRANSNRPIKGLVVMAKAHQAPAPFPSPPPSAALEWFGTRIRGLNFEVRHDNPDGSIVRGWHEHIWSPIYRDALVVPAKPEVVRRTLRDVFRWGLKKWRIEVIMDQVDCDDA